MLSFVIHISLPLCSCVGFLSHYFVEREGNEQNLTESEWEI